MIQHSKIVILGSGPAGASAAIYCARAMNDTLLFTGSQPGGQLTLTTEIENYPGVTLPMDGSNLVQNMLNQATQFGTRLINNHIVKVELGSRPFVLTTDTYQTYSCEALIIATGSKTKWLGLESETEYRASGVSSCATCDGFFYKNKDVVVIGGGNSAVEEALYLSKIAAKVTIVHRRDHFTAERILQERLFATPNINILWQYKVEEILGEKRSNEERAFVTGVRLAHVTTAASQLISTSAVFIAIGYEPQSKLFENQLTLYNNGYIQTLPDSTATSIKGVFAAGDVADPVFRQAITAAGSGCIAAIEADNFLKNVNILR